MEMLESKAPAKINLYLRVVGRRTDGYHLLDTLMVPLSLHDTVVLEPAASGITVSCRQYPELDGEVNLAHRAAREYTRRAGRPAGVNIRIDKKIPIQAGLGGGSSDAAAALLGLQRLSGGALGSSALFALAAELGADVPFFLAGGACRCTGVGELLQAVENIEPFWVVLACAPFGLPTRLVYANLNSPLTSNAGNAKETTPFPALGFEDIVARLHNDLQAVGERLRPVVGSVCNELKRAGAAGAAMTGSGPTLFGLCRSPGHAQETLARMEREPGWNYLIAEGLTSRNRNDDAT